MNVSDEEREQYLRQRERERENSAPLNITFVRTREGRCGATVSGKGVTLVAAASNRVDALRALADTLTEDLLERMLPDAG